MLFFSFISKLTNESVHNVSTYLQRASSSIIEEVSCLRISQLIIRSDQTNMITGEIPWWDLYLATVCIVRLHHPEEQTFQFGNSYTTKTWFILFTPIVWAQILLSIPGKPLHLLNCTTNIICWFFWRNEHRWAPMNPINTDINRDVYRSKPKKMHLNRRITIFKKN